MHHTRGVGGSVIYLYDHQSGAALCPKRPPTTSAFPKAETSCWGLIATVSAARAVRVDWANIDRDGLATDSNVHAPVAADPPLNETLTEFIANGSVHYTWLDHDQKSFADAGCA